jgi:hypothetical protein
MLLADACVRSVEKFAAHARLLGALATREAQLRDHLRIIIM